MCVNHKENGLVTGKPHHFPLKISEILKTYIGWWQKTKSISRVSNIVKNIATIDVILMSLL